MQESSTKIRRLPEDLTNKIAAGEVVERPASVVKELLENALDAGATVITVVAKDGGRTLMQVVDNGCGMSREDAQMAFQRHATSKIRTVEDLEEIRTLGFRGEALASIASVAQVAMRTMESGASEATIVELEGGNVTEVRIGAGTPGTSIAVRNLFFNTPGRRKFVKSATTEYRQLLAVVNRFAVGHHTVQFTFVHNDEIILEVPPAATLEDRLVALYGNRLRDALVPVSDPGSACVINGVVGKQSTVRQSRGEQFLYLNQRYITDRSLHHAIVSAYGEILAHGGFPFYAVFLQVNPQRVDVNVHPTKMEVKFADDRLIYALLRGAVRRALSSAAVIPTETSLVSNVPVVPWLPAPELPAAEAGGSDLPAAETPAWGEQDFRIKHPGRQLGLELPSRARAEEAASEPVELVPDESARVVEPSQVWQVHNRYILSQVPSGLVVIDQHVAHERILYEQALASFAKEDAPSQSLLFPVVLELSAEDYDLALEMLPFLRKIGFALRPFGRLTLMMEGVPSGTRFNRGAQEPGALLRMIDDYRRGKRENLEIRDNIARSFACHSAIRSGDRLTLASMNALIDRLFATRSPYFCPHGRPVVINIPLAELDKRFGRT